MRQRFLTFAVFGILLIGIGEWALHSRKVAGLLKLNDFWLEFCIGNSGDKIRPPAVTLVRIDDGYEPLQIGGDGTAPVDGKLSRLDFATILGFVGKLNPRSIAFLATPTFDEKLVLNQTDIVPLKDAAMRLPKFIVASTVTNDGGQAKAAKALAYPALKIEGEADAILAFTRTIIFPDPQILENGIPAFKSIESARDLVTEDAIRVPLVAKHGDQIIPSVVLAAVANHAGVPFDQITVNLSGKKPVIQVGETHTIPIAADGTMSLPAYAGISQSMRSVGRDEAGAMTETLHFTSLTVEELAYTGEADDEVAKRILADYKTKFDSLKENLVVIGNDRITDRRIATATGEMLSETTMLARAIAVIQSGRFIERWPGWARGVAVLAIFLIAAMVFRLPRRKFVPATLIAGLVFFVAMVMIFSATLTWTPPFVVMSLFVLLLLVGLLIPVAVKAKP